MADNRRILGGEAVALVEGGGVHGCGSRGVVEREAVVIDVGVGVDSGGEKV